MSGPYVYVVFWAPNMGHERQEILGRIALLSRPEMSVRPMVAKPGRDPKVEGRTHCIV